MKKIRIAINGFGRIGRNAFKVAALHAKECQVVAINDLTDTKTLAHLLQYDSAYGVYHEDVKYTKDSIVINGEKIRVYAEKDPAALPWKKENIDVVIESTGRFVDRDGASLHLKAGARRVIISAPSKGENPAPTHVLGVNPAPAGSELISNASCTTNCITPVMAVLEEEFGIAKALMSTVHSYTQSQMLQDGPSKDIREARAAALNIVPTSTGAAIATTLSLPALKGKFDGLSFRVPTPVVSLADITIVSKKRTTVEEVNKALVHASKLAKYRGILAATDRELVSTDYRGNSYSAIIDLSLTRVVGGDLVKVVAWYDNEWGYSNRLVEQAILIAQS